MAGLTRSGGDEARAALGVEGDEVQRDGIAGGGVLIVGAVVEEAGEEGDGALAARASAARASAVLEVTRAPCSERLTMARLLSPLARRGRFPRPRRERAVACRTFCRCRDL